MFRSFATVTLVIATTGALAGGAQHEIHQKGRLFSPGALTVKSGDVVVFQNDDKVTHHVYSPTKGQEFELETVAPGDKASHTFKKTGRVDVRCGLHPGMRLVVTVE
jgi:plastocyanin